MGGVCSCSKGIARSASVAPEEAGGGPGAEERPAIRKSGHRANRRGSVSAEAALGTVKGKKLVPKPDEARARLKQLIKSTLLFNELEDDQEEDVISALFERKVTAGEVIIREGEVGDNFYLIESGQFRASKGGETKFTYDGKGSFGELALMYNCPRAATVTAETEGTLWGMDRTTFRAVIVSSMVERRSRYEATLQSMSIFRHLSHEQLAAIADCLTVEQYEAGQLILQENEELATNAKFYMIESGTVECLRTFDGKKRLTKTLGAGDVFGEVALLTKAPRQADCVAATKVKCLAMSRDAFERLMGPVEESLAQHIAEYNQFNADAASPRPSQPRSSAPASATVTTPDTSAQTAVPSQPSSAPSLASSRGHSQQQEVPAAAPAAAVSGAGPAGTATPAQGAGPARASPSRSRSREAAREPQQPVQQRQQQEGSVARSRPGSRAAGHAAGAAAAPKVRLGRTSSGEQGSPSKVSAQVLEWEQRLSSSGSEEASSTGSSGCGSGNSGAPDAKKAGEGSGPAAAAPVHRKGSGRGSNSAEAGSGNEGAPGSPGLAASEADEARRMADLVATQPAEEVPACTLEPIEEDQNEGSGGSRRVTGQH